MKKMKNVIGSQINRNPLLHTRLVLFVVLALFLVFANNLIAQEAKEELSDEELAKKLANPVSSLISLPLQNNSDFGIGETKGSRNTLNVQPVIPLALSEKVNLIIRIVQPVITQYNITGLGEHQRGLGDAVVTAFFSPIEIKKGIIWGLGPVFLIPDGTHELFTRKKFGTGVSGVILTQSKGWTIGALLNQVWSIAGNSERPDISQFYILPFISYDYKNGAGYGITFEMTQNWKTNTTDLWLNTNMNGVVAFGKQKTSLALGPRFNLAAPVTSKAAWGVRCSLTFVFPK